MAYQALYRQWRPFSFSQMVGQEAVVRTLKNQIVSGRIAHAYLFCGSRGTGKTSAAKIMARAVNCLSPREGDPCGECSVCQSLQDDTSLDVLEIDAASNNGVDEIRDLRDKVKYPPQVGKYKVYIIDEVHMLTGAAFNALLKTLEEPPAHIVFILATTEPQKLPATVLSRCQRFDFGRIPAHQIAGRLKEAVDRAGVAADPEALALIARAAEGGMRDALSILDMCLGYGGEVTEDLVRSVLGTADKLFLFTFADALCDGNAQKAMQLVDELMRTGREPQVFSRDMAYHLRALLMAAACGEEIQNLLDITKEDASRYMEQAARFSQGKLLRLLDLFMKVEMDMRWASAPRIALEAASLKACFPSGEASAEGLLERIEALEQRSQTLVQPIIQAAQPLPEKKDTIPKKSIPDAETLEKKETAKAEQPSSKQTGLTPRQIWDQALQHLKKTDTGLFSQLMGGTFGGCRGDLYRIVLPKEENFICNHLNKERRKEAVEAALSEAGGVQARFEAVLEDGGKEASQQRTQDTLQELMRDFGRDKVQIEEE